ncbi:MAG: hypothetical protein SGJ02_05745 [bacterium]|nr:hypothetical protein [bacterium]
MSTDPNNSADQTKQDQEQTQTDDSKSQESKATQDSNKDKNFEALRKSNETLAKKIAVFEKEKSDSEKAKLEEKGEIQKLLDIANKEKDEISSKYQTEKRQSLLEKELAKSGINAELIDLILPSITSQIEFDESNLPKNLSEVVDNLKANKPSLFAELKAGPAGKVGAGVAKNSENQTLTKEKAVSILTENKSNSAYKGYTDKELYDAINS